MLLIRNGGGLLMDDNCRQYGFRGNGSGIIREGGAEFAAGKKVIYG